MEPSKDRRRKIAIFLNAFAMPGVGHIFLGYKARGIILLFTCIIFLIIPLVKYFLLMSYALNAVQRSMTDPSAMLMESTIITWHHMKNSVLLGIAGVVVIWLFSIIDIYYIQKRDKNSGDQNV